MNLALLLLCVPSVVAALLRVPFTSSGSTGEFSVSIGSQSTFLLSVRFGGWGASPLDSPSLDETRGFAPGTAVSWGGSVGLSTSFGALLVSPTGSWALYDAANNTLVSSSGPPQQVPNGAGEGGVLFPVQGVDALAGPTQVDNCLNNGIFGPPFYFNPAGAYLAFPVSSWLYDPTRPHCYGVSFQGPPAAPPTNPSCGNFSSGKRSTDPVRSLSFPGGLNVASQKECCYFCSHDESCVGADYAPGPQDPTLEANCFPLRGFSGVVDDAEGWAYSGLMAPPPAPTQPGWWVLGDGAADLYLAPAPTPISMLKALYQLTGAPGIPPRYAFGSMYTYWGYDDMEEVEGNMTRFRDGAFPIDSHIMDYDWWNPNYIYNDTGVEDYDFAYDPVFFGPHSFVHPPGSSIPNVTTQTVKDIFNHFHNDLHLKFAGIRKPRTYSHHNLSNSSGWLLPSSFEVGAGPNNWNMTPGNGWSDWWVPRTAHFLEDGMDFWWNDEGETQWFTYTWWNSAQSQVAALATPGKRFFTVNRAYQPGMQRYPATTWTGDSQECSHVKTLGFVAVGQLYHECDMTSPSATVLVRQYQNAILSPIFRVHQMHGVPRFPFLWGTPEHADAMRTALNMRYALIPHLYSLSHRARRELLPLASPASWYFTGVGAGGAVLDTTYLYGGTLLPTDVSVVRVGGGDAEHPFENTTTVYLPGGGPSWFLFNSTSVLPGGQRITKENVPLGVFEVYALAGSLLALQGGPSQIQHTGEMGGLLTLQVYAGGNASFTLVEDDGESLDYDATRDTLFEWDEGARVLSWSVVRDLWGGGANDFTQLEVALFVGGASGPVIKGGFALGSNGTVQF